MNIDTSFWKATNRHKLTPKDWHKAQSSYDFNYSNLLPHSKDAPIVDLGCSEGIALQWLVSMGYKNVKGVDSDNIAIGHARNLLKDYVSKDHIISEDILDFVGSQKDGSIEMFLMFNAIEHLSKSYLLKLIPEIKRVLKAGGSFLVQTGNIENPFNFGLFARDFTHEIPFTKNSLKQLMTIGGFPSENVWVQPLTYKTTIINFLLQFSSHLFSYVIKALAFFMRMRISETSPIIFCIAEKKF